MNSLDLTSEEFLQDKLERTKPVPRRPSADRREIFSFSFIRALYDSWGDTVNLITRLWGMTLILFHIGAELVLGIEFRFQIFVLVIFMVFSPFTQKVNLSNLPILSLFLAKRGIPHSQ